MEGKVESEIGGTSA